MLSANPSLQEFKVTTHTTMNGAVIAVPSGRFDIPLYKLEHPTCHLTAVQMLLHALVTNKNIPIGTWDIEEDQSFGEDTRTWIVKRWLF